MELHSTKEKDPSCLVPFVFDPPDCIVLLYCTAVTHYPSTVRKETTVVEDIYLNTLFCNRFFNSSTVDLIKGSIKSSSLSAVLMRTATVVN